MHLLGLWLKMAIGEGRTDARKLRFMMAVSKDVDNIGSVRIGGAGVLHGSSSAGNWITVQGKEQTWGFRNREDLLRGVGILTDDGVGWGGSGWYCRSTSESEVCRRIVHCEVMMIDEVMMMHERCDEWQRKSPTV